YPSGDRLHVGHWYNFGPADSFGRYMRMKGYNVFEPMGFDAFGLPAENHAIKTGTPPAESTEVNTATMVDQLKKIGTIYDWSRTLNTSKPEYYRWTQWLFLQMYKHGIAYKKEAAVNWCDTCQTVLANEQAQDGTCERCATEVVQKPLKQWFWKITDYAQRLLDGLDDLDWPEKTKLMQQNWIGRSEGADVVFELVGTAGKVEVFTTRPDTLFGATYMVLAPEHPLVLDIVTDGQRKEIMAYIKAVKKKTEMQRTDLEKDKTGVFTGGYAVNPVNGEKIPVWIADYVLMTYGTGAIMAVPAHDERDFEFAKKFDLPVREVVSGGNVSETAFAEEGTAVNSGFLDGFSTPDAKKKMIKWLGDKKLGRGVVNFRLRDWLISRQRYWGAPIPIVYDPDGKAHPIPDEHLPWLLPTDTEFKPKGTSPLGQSKELKARTERLFGKGWKPEIDTMDTFVCSSFYYLRYLMAGSGSADSGAEAFINPKIEKKWMPVDMYIGGPEHACMHLIYARFVMMALKDFGFVSHSEPFARLVHQGLIKYQGLKMSKTKGNTVSPDEFVSFYGSDVFRMYLMFMGPFTDGGDWNDKGITGIARFVDRFYGFIAGEAGGGGGGDAGKGDVGAEKTGADAAVLSALHKTIKRVTEDIEKMQFNTAIAALMEFLNGAVKTGLSVEGKRILVRLIAPLAPHLAEELWKHLGGKKSVFNEKWPEYDPALTVSATVTLAVQVNGKLRGQVEVATGISLEEALKAAAEVENVAKHLEGKEIVKKIYVPGKLVSFVVK
ncbi:leucine--tRNA ligase, partial [Patescibacteria group bacterium]|nr:leucine--tRNA ligase [Patescibacteria group bacterium]